MHETDKMDRDGMHAKSGGAGVVLRKHAMHGEGSAHG